MLVVRFMLGADTRSMSASSLLVRAVASRRHSTENGCGGSSRSDAKRTRREMRMQASRMSLESETSSALESWLVGCLEVKGGSSECSLVILSLTHYLG